MNVKVSKANAFEIDPNKKYLVILSIEEKQWTMEQRDQLTESLAARNMQAVFIPKGTKYKIVEEAEKEKVD